MQNLTTACGFVRILPPGIMSAIIQSEQPEVPSPSSTPHAAPSPLLRTVAACDLVESTAMIEQLGDRGAAGFMHLLDRQSRDLLYRHGGQEIDKTDGFLLLFERPIQAVAFALEYQRLLRELGDAEFLPLRARIGIHVGDVVLWRNVADDVARGAKPVEIEGLVKPIAARLMNLALAGADAAVRDCPCAGAARAGRARCRLPEPPQWRSHGEFPLQGHCRTGGSIRGRPTSALHHCARRRTAARRTAKCPGGGARAMLAAGNRAAATRRSGFRPIFRLRSPPAIAFAARDWVVVGDLKNQTGQGVLDDSLDAAFRVSVEQSRYVNLVSELQMRNALARMEKPADTRD